MTAIWLLTFGLGVLTVLQGGLNRLLSTPNGLATTVFLNATVFMAAAGINLWLQRHTVPESFSLPAWSWLPGLFGFAFVLGVPFAIVRLGALPVFATLIAAQLLTGFLWDFWVEGYKIEPVRVVACLLTFSGAALLWWKS
jgi:transporter family-2 protein